MPTHSILRVILCLCVMTLVGIILIACQTNNSTARITELPDQPTGSSNSVLPSTSTEPALPPSIVPAVTQTSTTAAIEPLETPKLIAIAASDVTPIPPSTIGALSYSTALFSLGWSPDGTRIAAATGNVDSNVSRVVVWDLDTGTQLFLADTASIYPTTHKLAWAQNQVNGNSQLAAGGLGDEVFVWDGETGEEIYRLNDQNASTLMSLEFNPQGTLLATGRIAGNEDKLAVYVWDIQQAEEKYSPPVIENIPSDDKLLDVCWSRGNSDDNILSILTDSGSIVVWNIVTGDTRVLTGFNNASMLECSFDGSRLGVASAGQATILESANYSSLYTLESTSNIIEITFARDSKTLGLVLHDGSLILADATTGTITYFLNTFGLADIEWSPDNTKIAVLANGVITIFMYSQP